MQDRYYMVSVWWSEMWSQVWELDVLRVEGKVSFTKVRCCQTPECWTKVGKLNGLNTLCWRNSLKWISGSARWKYFGQKHSPIARCKAIQHFDCCSIGSTFRCSVVTLMTYFGIWDSDEQYHGLLLLAVNPHFIRISSNYIWKVLLYHILHWNSHF